MFGMGISLRIEDFRRVFVFPKAVALGVVGQIILLPVFGYLLTLIFNLAPEHAVGLIVLVACAGGAVSNLIVYLAKGDVALSVTLTAISCCITVVTIPFLINFALAEFMAVSESKSLPVGITNIRLFLLTVLPVLCGMLIGRYYPAFTLRAEKHIARIATIFFVVIVASILVKERARLVDLLFSVGPLVICLNIFTLAVGFALARLIQLNIKQSVAISIEMGVQNSATGIYIATSLLQNSEIASVPAVYSIVMLVNSGLLIAIARKYKKYTLSHA